MLHLDVRPSSACRLNVVITVVLSQDGFRMSHLVILSAEIVRWMEKGGGVSSALP